MGGGGGKWDIVQGESSIHKEKYGSFRQTRTKIQKKRQILATRSKSDEIQRSGIIQPELSYHKIHIPAAIGKEATTSVLVE